MASKLDKILDFFTQLFRYLNNASEAKKIKKEEKKVDEVENKKEKAKNAIHKNNDEVINSILTKE